MKREQRHDNDLVPADDQRIDALQPLIDGVLRLDASLDRALNRAENALRARAKAAHMERWRELAEYFARPITGRELERPFRSDAIRDHIFGGDELRTKGNP